MRSILGMIGLASQRRTTKLLNFSCVCVDDIYMTQAFAKMAVQTDAAALRVLLVEDDPDDAFLIEHRLSSETQFIVDRVEDLSEAAERLAATPYDVMLLDLGLPGTDGVETIEAATAIGSSCPIVVMTGAADDRLVRSSFQRGVDDYLPKSAAATEILPRVLIHAIERDLARSAIAAQLAADEANLAKSAFLSRVSHELRTPLHAIMGFADLLESQAVTADDLEATGFILMASTHLLALIDDLLDISRIETGDLAVLFERVAVWEIVRDAIDLIQHDVGDAQLEVLGCTTQALYAHGDRQRIRQVLLNLLSNALRYGPSDGRVTIEATTEADGCVQITVSDEGPGVSGEDVDAIFAPFDRLGHEHGAIEGVGLGLTVSRELVEAMNGAIGVDTTPGQGARFWFKLPSSTG